MDNYLTIAENYKQSFDKYGETPQGLNWSNQSDMNTRYRTMAELIQGGYKRISLLDFGCGYGGFYKWLLDNNYPNVDYSGIDINENLINKAKHNYGNDLFKTLDIHKESLDQTYDYIVCNGVFTVKYGLTYNQMFSFFTSTLEKLWEKTEGGIAFNAMSKLVDWERDDLFHLSMDRMGEWISSELSRNFVINNNYGLYEYTVYIYR